MISCRAKDGEKREGSLGRSGTWEEREEVRLSAESKVAQQER